MYINSCMISKKHNIHVKTELYQFIKRRRSQYVNVYPQSYTFIGYIINSKTSKSC